MSGYGVALGRSVGSVAVHRVAQILKRPAGGADARFSACLRLLASSAQAWRRSNTIFLCPARPRYYGFNHAHFVTTSTYRRVRVFDPEPFKDLWVRAVGKVRDALQFKLIGYVLMPEHFHLLFWTDPEINPSDIVRSLKIRTAMEILKFLREHPTQPWCRQTLNSLRLPPTVHSPAAYRVWQRRFFDLNLWTTGKILEKLNYMHANPVKRGLVRLAEEWPWSSYRYYHCEDPAALAMDHLP